jgi:hypothetical protein
MGGSGDVLHFLSRLLLIETVIMGFLTAGFAGLGYFITYITSKQAALDKNTLIAVGVGVIIVAVVYLGGSVWKTVAVGSGHNVGYFRATTIIMMATIVTNVLSFILGVSLFN